MCGRVIVDYDEVMGVAGDTELAEWIVDRPAPGRPSWNVRPTEQIPVVLTNPHNGNKLWKTAYWSLIPPWSNELKPKFPTFNARSETVTEKRSFAPSVRAQRCAITPSAFYEWSGPKDRRIPHAVFGPRPLLPLAGLYSWWREPGASHGEGWHLTVTILTQPSAGVMLGLHERMPVFLAGDLTEDWLDPRTEGNQLLVDAVTERSVAMSEQLREHMVRPLRGDGPELIEPAEHEPETPVL